MTAAVNVPTSGPSPAITILADDRTESFLVRISPCPPDWSNPEAEFACQLSTAGYIDILLARYPEARCRVHRGRFDDDWRPMLESVS